MNREPIRKQLGQIGVFSRHPYFREAEQATILGAAAEEIGYPALWIPGFDGGHIFERCALALEASERLTIATGIVNIWRHEAPEVAETVSKLQADSGGRFLLGIGTSHKALIGDDYDNISPLAKMKGYLDELDDAGQAPEDRCLAALGPKMLELSAERAAGTHPYFVPVEHTAYARKLLGDGPLIMPVVSVFPETDPVKARANARRKAKLYLGMPNYTNNLRRLGYTDDDLSGEGSDRLIDAVYAWGDTKDIVARVQEHLDAGADHVVIQSFADEPETDVWRELLPHLPVRCP